MADYQVAWNAGTKTVVIQAQGDALPVGSVNIGSFIHQTDQDPLGDNPTHQDGPANDASENHVMYHHVRDLLYKVGHQDMQIVIINQDVDYIDLIDFTVVPATVGRTVGQTQQLTHVFNPTDASNKKLSYVSSHPARATVSSTGLITAVGAGVATITVTSEDDAVVHTCVVTVT